MKSESPRQKAQNNRKVSIVIPALENLDLTRNCWRSIQKNTAVDYEILLVDNGSTEPLSPAAEAEGVYCIRNENNLGFAAAVNQGLQAAQGEFLVVLNNDTLVTPHWMDRLLEHFEADPRLGMLAPVTNYANNSVQRIDTNYSSETTLYQFSSQRYETHQGQRIAQNKVAGVCMVIPRGVMETVGLFDTRFGIGNFEDDDYCLRVRQAGYGVAVANDVFVHHEGGCTFRLLDINYEALLKRNSELFLQKWAPVLGAQGAAQATADLRGPATEARQGLTTIMLQDEEQLDIEAIENILGALPESSNVQLVCEKSAVATLCEEAGIPVLRAARSDLLRALDQQVRAAETTRVLVVSSRLVAQPGWVEPLMAQAADLVLVLPQSSSDTPEALPPLDLSQGVAVLIEKTAYEELGGLSKVFASGVAWEELKLRMEDAGMQVETVDAEFLALNDSQPTACRVDPHEQQLVQSLVDVKKKVTEGDLQQALVDLQEMLTAKPEFIPAHSWSGFLHTAREEWELAQAAFQRILELEPSHAAAHNNLGCLAYEAGDVQGAATHFEATLQLQPNNIEAARNLAHVCFETGNPQRALDLYVGIVQKAPEDPQTYLELGTWYEKMGETAGAGDWYRQALQVAPDCEEAQQRLQTLESTSSVRQTETVAHN